MLSNNKPLNPVYVIDKWESSLNSSVEKAKPAGDVNRHVKTEEEADKELIKEVTETNKIFRFEQTPWFVENGEMRDYQIRGLNWLIQLYQNNSNGILADEMGLGKTLQTISMLGYLKHCCQLINGKFIVIVPKSTLQNWMNELKRWVPSLRARSLIGNQEERFEILKDLRHDWDVLVTTYELAIKEKTPLKRYTYTYLVIDEAHRIKNEKSKLSEVVRELKSENRLLITGTPLQNNLHELWALLNFLMPQLFYSAESFDELFNNESLEERSLVFRLHNILKPFLLRRLKIEVEKKLPPKKEIKVYIGLTKMQRELYTKILMKDIEYLNSNAKHTDRNRLQNILMQLRKCTNHPYLFDGIEPGPPYTTDYHLVGNCGKMVLLDKLLKKLKESGSRVLVFTQMTHMLDILEDYCRWRGYEYCRLDGQTAHTDRQESIDLFNSENSSKFLFMLSTRAGGLGINLTSADTVILYDSDWNPQVDLQAQDRAHRIGQTRSVHVYRLITEHTVEERIIARADMKLRLDSVVIQQQGRHFQSSGNQNKLEKGDMLSMIRHGANYIFKSSKDGGDIPDEDIDALLARGQEKTNEIQKKLDEIEKKMLKDSGDGSGIEGKFLLTFDTLDDNNGLGDSVYNFEGENYKNKANETNTNSSGNGNKNKINKQPMFWIEPPKRERKSNYALDLYLGKDTHGNSSTAEPKSSKIPKPPKHPVIYDFQFFPDLLWELLDKELLYYHKKIGYRVPKDDSSKETKRAYQRQQAKINAAQPLTEDEQMERDVLLRRGFFDWSKKDFQAFIKANERFGRNNMADISMAIPGKSPEEIRKYSHIFWKNYRQINDYEKFLKQIERGDKKREHQQQLVKAVELKMSMYKAPMHQLKLQYVSGGGSSGGSGKQYSEAEDRFMICVLYKLGGTEVPGVYYKLQEVIRKAPQFRLDWFIRSRTPAELQKRCNILINMIHREISELNDRLIQQKKKQTQIKSYANKIENSLYNDDKNINNDDRNDDDDDNMKGIDNDMETAIYDVPLTKATFSNDHTDVVVMKEEFKYFGGSDEVNPLNVGDFTENNDNNNNNNDNMNSKVEIMDAAE